MIKDFINNQVGFIRVNKPIVYVDNQFECAAWWEERTSKTGIYPLLLQKANYYSNDYNVVADVPGVITNDYFPSLWGGVAISNKPYETKYVGQESRPIKVGSSLTEAILKTSNSPGSDIDYYIDFEFYKMYISNRKEELRKAYNELPACMFKYMQGDDKHYSNLGMVRHYSDRIVYVAREIENLSRAVDYLEEENDMWRKLYKQNTEWIKEYNEH